MEWTARTVWWLRAITVGVLVMLVAGREYPMKRANLKHKTEERKAHTGKAAQALWGKDQNGCGRSLPVLRLG